jgi:aminoglycoside phosphotransferase (APT) family kinase protein
MAAQLPELVPPLTFTLIAGGRSNLTFRVDDAAGHKWALRRPPLHHVLPTAHDMSREYRLMHSLYPAGIPVPVTVGLCTDEAVNERPFYVMEFVEGHIVRSATEAEAAFDEAARRAVGDHMADTLAALHDVDPDAVGLGDLGRHEGYIERQLKRWRGQYEQMQVEGVDHDGLVDRVSDDLARRIPKQQRTSVVHGDYRMDNVVLADDGSVRAILDWEICTLGDPLADLGLLMVYWTDPTDQTAVLGLSPTTAKGFATRAEVLERYGSASDLDISEVGYYVAFGYWKLGCILQGVYARYVAGAGAGDQGSVDSFPAQIGRLFEMAAASLESVP